MAIIYCDYTNGDDDTGDGTAGTPYQTIQKASTGLSGGDEVRVAKSPAATSLTGTLEFTKGSAAVTGSGTNFDPEITIGDFIEGADGRWYEVITVTDDTNLILYKVYPSATADNADPHLLGVTSTGEAAATTTQVQSVLASGTSNASRLKISGGWDLTGPTQDGETFFRQMHGTFNNRYGYGFYITGKSFLDIEKIHFLRYYFGTYMLGHCHSFNIDTFSTLSSQYEGMYFSSVYGFNMTNCASSCNNRYGLSTATMVNSVFTNFIANSNSMGVYLNTSPDNRLIKLETKYNPRGINISKASNTIISDWTCNNSTQGLYDTGYHSKIIIEKVLFTDNTTDVLMGTTLGQENEDPRFQIQHFNTAGDNRCYYQKGITSRDTADARSTQCLKYDPDHVSRYISQSFYFKANSGVAQTLSAYIKDDAAFNGDVVAAIYFLGLKITGWTTWTTTTSYVQKTIIAALGDITEDGVLELRIKVRGTAGNVFVDDLATA